MTLVAAFILSFFACGLRFDILSEYYNPVNGLIKGAANETALMTALIFAGLIFIGGIAFNRRKRLNKYYTKDRTNTVQLAAEGLAAIFLFGPVIRALGILDFDYSTRVSSEGLIALFSVIAAAAQIINLNPKDRKKPDQILGLLSLAPVLLLMSLVFTFYFDRTTIISNSNKTLATLTLICLMVYTVLDSRFIMGMKKTAPFLFFASTSFMIGLVYSLPNIVYYFTVSRLNPVLLDITFDLIILAFSLKAGAGVFSLNRERRRKNDKYYDEEYFDSEKVAPVKTNGNITFEDYDDFKRGSNDT